MGNTVLITGASRGIGAACAKEFAEKGWNVAINYHHSRDEAQALANKLNAAGGRAVALGADVSLQDEAERLVRATLEQFGGVDVLVNNAGVAATGLFSQTGSGEIERLFQVNIGGVLNCSRAVIEHMLKQKRGKIISISSIWGITGASCEVAYSTSKAAVIGFTRALAKELGPSGIRVNCIAPGLINTEMNAALSVSELKEFVNEIPLGYMGSPADVAALAYYLSGPESDYITGQVISPNGGYLI